MFQTDRTLVLRVRRLKYVISKTGGTNILLVRPAYSYSIVLIVFVLRALINVHVRSEY